MAGESALFPHLIVDDAAAAIDFYGKAFGAEELDRIPGPDGRLIHADIRINGSIIMLNDDFPGVSGGSTTPRALGGSPVTIHLTVPDADQAFDRAVSAGATVAQPLEDQFWGDRYGVLVDPFGHHWSIGQHIRDVSLDEIRDAAQRM